MTSYALAISVWVLLLATVARNLGENFRCLLAMLYFQVLLQYLLKLLLTFIHMPVMGIRVVIFVDVSSTLVNVRGSQRRDYV